MDFKIVHVNISLFPFFLTMNEVESFESKFIRENRQLWIFKFCSDEGSTQDDHSHVRLKFSKTSYSHRTIKFLTELSMLLFSRLLMIILR